MMQDVLKFLQANVAESRKILEEARRIREKGNLTEDDYRQLAELRVDLMGLCPPLRYAWKDAAPCIDIWQELLKIEGRNFS
jgi:hypothetical protein